MSQLSSNPCTRCGQERIEGKSYKEVVATFLGTSTIIHTDTICPDPECQKIVEEKIEIQRVKTEELKAEKQKKLDEATLLRKKRALEKLKN